LWPLGRRIDIEVGGEAFVVNSDLGYPGGYCLSRCLFSMCPRLHHLQRSARRNTRGYQQVIIWPPFPWVDGDELKYLHVARVVGPLSADGWLVSLGVRYDLLVGCASTEFVCAMAEVPLELPRS